VKKLLFTLPLLVALALVVWFAPYSKRLDIHDIPTFRFVLLLGLFQTVVAVYGGYLAVLALQAEHRPPHLYFFATLGLALFGLSFCVGVLNDKSQYEIQSKLNTSNAGLVRVYEALPTLKPCDLSGVDAIRKYIDKVLRSTNSPAEPQKPVSFPPVTPGPVISKPDPDPAPAPMDQIRWKITMLADSLRLLDATANTKRARIGKVMEQDAYARNVSPNGPMTKEFVDQIVATDDEEIAAYVKDWLPQILAFRISAKQYRTVGQLADDEKNFQAANTSAMSPNRVPRTGYELWNVMDNQNKQGGMTGYLVTIAQQMRGAH
jgi:hypothetical protein